MLFFSLQMSFRCYHCEAHQPSLEEFYFHWLTSHPAQSSPFCPVSGCLQILETIDAVDGHLQKAHTEIYNKSAVAVPSNTQPEANLHCTHCNIYFIRLQDYYLHCSSEHPSKKEIFCPIKTCTSAFSGGPDQVNAHLKLIHKFDFPVHKSNPIIGPINQSPNHSLNEHSKSFRCYYCELSFTLLDDFYAHHAESHFDCNVVFCPVPDCGSTFGNFFAIDKHLANDHPKSNETDKSDQKPFRCYYCDDQQFTSLQDFYDHNCNSKSFICCPMPGCNNSFFDKGRVAEHLRVSHRTFTPSKDLRFRCLMCTTKMASVSEFYKHFEVQHGSSISFYPCPVPDCLLHFETKSALDQHLVVCHNVIQFRCQICYGKMRSVLVFYNHLETTHKDCRDFYPCPFGQCTERFDKKDQLDLHLVIVHDIVFDESMVNPVPASLEPSPTIPVVPTNPKWNCPHCKNYRPKTSINYLQHLR